MITSRRSFITGLAALVAAPAIVRAAPLMPVRGIVMDVSSMKLVKNYDIVMSPNMYAELARVTREAMLPNLYLQIMDQAKVWTLLDTH